MLHRFLLIFRQAQYDRKLSPADCGMSRALSKLNDMLSISVNELRQKLNDKEDLLLIDVREAWEHEAFNIGGTLISLNTLFENTDLVDRNKPVIMYCQKGIRSQLAIQRLQQKYNYTNLINLSGGMDAWKKEFNK